jgi:hypothetical protein
LLLCCCQYLHSAYMHNWLLSCSALGTFASPSLAVTYNVSYKAICPWCPNSPGMLLASCSPSHHAAEHDVQVKPGRAKAMQHIQLAQISRGGARLACTRLNRELATTSALKQVSFAAGCACPSPLAHDVLCTIVTRASCRSPGPVTITPGHAGADGWALDVHPASVKHGLACA